VRADGRARFVLQSSGPGFANREGRMKFVAKSEFDIEAFVAESTYLEFFIEGEVTSGTSTRLVITDEFEGIVEQLILTGSFGDYEDGYPTTGIVTGGQYSITGGESFSFSDASITVEAFTSYVINNDLMGLLEDLFGG